MTNTPAMSEDIRALTAAFLLAKKEFSNTGLSGKNSHQGYKYAKIEDIYHAVEAALGKNNIIIWHFARPDHREGCKERELLYTRLIHTLTGQFVEDCRVMESEKPGNQGRGGANTYCKKYAVLSLCAIGAEDDDGEAEQKYIDQKANEPCISDKELKFIIDQLETAQNGDELFANILRFNKVKDLEELKVSQFSGVKSHIEKNRK